ncbi:PaaI family thioesterase [Novosphingobium sp.]|uniref:PaaI family thioesterase n=1 Tax=Novosphingobium sp. TaxID=1874826 RepID=UPI003B51A3E6
MKRDQLPPYALTMGMTFAGIVDDIPVIAMDFAERVLGRPGFLHGGAIGSLLETAGFAALAADLARRGVEAHIKPININIEYLRSGLPEPIFAVGNVLRAGRRVANVQVEAWQGDRTRPVASCWMNIQLLPVMD